MAEPIVIHDDPFVPSGDANAVPYDFGQARAVMASASRRHAEAVRALAEASEGRKAASELLADKEMEYRRQLAKEIIELKAAGIAITVAGDLARGGKDARGRDTDAAQRRYERDVARGALKAADELVRQRREDLTKCEKDRDDARELVRWSREVAPNGEQREPDRPSADLRTFGRRAA